MSAMALLATNPDATNTDLFQAANGGADYAEALIHAGRTVVADGLCPYCGETVQAALTGAATPRFETRGIPRRGEA